MSSPIPVLGVGSSSVNSTTSSTAPARSAPRADGGNSSLGTFGVKSGLAQMLKVLLILIRLIHANNATREVSLWMLSTLNR